MEQDPNAIESLNRDATKWTLVAIASFVFGIAALVGPFAWVKARAVRRQLAALGQPAHSSARLATIVAGAVTVLSWLGVLAIVGVLLGIRGSNTY
ncbi:MAG: hypothetical protein U0325_11800 [Polyangiales bacterium]